MFKLFKIFKNNKCELPPPGLYTSLASEMVSIYLERKRRKRKVMFKLFKKKEMWTTASNSKSDRLYIHYVVLGGFAEFPQWGGFVELVGLTCGTGRTVVWRD